MNIPERKQKDQFADEEVLTVRELASRLRFHPQTIYAAAARGRIPFFRIGASIRFRWPSVLDALQSGGLEKDDE